MLASPALPIHPFRELFAGQLPDQRIHRGDGRLNIIGRGGVIRYFSSQELSTGIGFGLFYQPIDLPVVVGFAGSDAGVNTRNFLFGIRRFALGHDSGNQYLARRIICRIYPGFCLKPFIIILSPYQLYPL